MAWHGVRVWSHIFRGDSAVKSWLEDRFDLIPITGFAFCIGTGQCFHVAVVFRVVPMVDLDGVVWGI